MRKSGEAVADALRLSRGMSFKNAMAGLPLGGGKAVILADEARTKTPEMLAAYGKAIEGLSGAYVTAEDVGISVADLVEVAKQTRYISGLPVASGAGRGRSRAVYQLRRLPRRQGGGEAQARQGQPAGLHIAIQGAGSVASGLARHAAAEGARLTIADVDRAKAEALAAETGGRTIAPDAIMTVEADVLSPCALGAILTPESIAALNVPVVAGGANNQLATQAEGDRLRDRGILYAPDYVINAGGIINVGMEYLGVGDEAQVRAPDRADPRPARDDLGREPGHRPQRRRRRRRHGAEADRAGIELTTLRSS